MLRATTLTAGLLLVAVVGARGQQTGSKIAYVNSQTIMEQAPGAAAAQTQFNQEMQVYEAEIERSRARIDSMAQRYEQQQLTLSPDARQRREEEIMQAQQELQTRGQQLEQLMARRQQELVQPVMDLINQVIDAIRSEGDYAFIFDVSAGSIIAADPSLDLTEEVIRRLRVQDPPSGPPSSN